METAALRRGYVYVTLAAALFAVNASVSKVVLEAGLEPAKLAALRSTGAAVGLGVILLAFAPRRLRVTLRELPALALLGVAGAALVQWLYFIAIQRIPIGIALLLEFTAPVFVALYVRVVRRQDVRRRTWLAIGVALAGLAMVAQVWTDTGLDPIGVMAGLGAAACVATYFLVGGHTVAARDTGSLTFYMFFFGGVFWAVSQPWWTVDLSMLGSSAPLLGALGAYSVPAWAGVVWIVMLGTLAPYALNLAALRRVSPTAVGVIGMSEPVGAGLVAWAWLGQALTAIQVAGGLIVLVGIGLVQRAAAPEPATAVQMRGKMLTGSARAVLGGYRPSMYVNALVNLYTHDIEAGLRFYRDLLGFEETFRAPVHGVPEHVELRLNGFTLGLGTVDAAKRVHGVEAAPGSPAMVVVVWTDDVDEAHRRLVAQGVPVVLPPHNTGNSNRNALLRDPDGNLVEIVAKVS